VGAHEGARNGATLIGVFYDTYRQRRRITRRLSRRTPASIFRLSSGAVQPLMRMDCLNWSVVKYSIESPTLVAQPLTT